MPEIHNHRKRVIDRLNVESVAAPTVVEDKKPAEIEFTFPTSSNVRKKPTQPRSEPSAASQSTSTSNNIAPSSQAEKKYPDIVFSAYTPSKTRRPNITDLPPTREPDNISPTYEPTIPSPPTTESETPPFSTSSSSFYLGMGLVIGGALGAAVTYTFMTNQQKGSMLHKGSSSSFSSSSSTSLIHRGSEASPSWLKLPGSTGSTQQQQDTKR